MSHLGLTLEGRHEPLVDEDLFERVQDVLDSHAVAGERQRVHHHYLKGTVFCGYCWKNGVTQRLAIQQVVKADGSQYSYFFCRRRRDGSCPGPHIGIHWIEDAVTEHYRQVRFSPPSSPRFAGTSTRRSPTKNMTPACSGSNSPPSSRLWIPKKTT